MDYIKVIDELNDKLEGTEFERLAYFNYETNGATEVIRFFYEGIDVMIWYSECDDCQDLYNDICREGNYDKKFFIDWVMTKISASSEIMGDVYNAMKERRL